MPLRSCALPMLATLCVLAALIPGCKSDDGPTGVPLTPELPVADTPDQLIANFAAVYAGLDLAIYRDDILADQYAFVLQPETVDAFDLPANRLDRDDELVIASHLFGGTPSRTGEALGGIVFESLQPQGAWQPVAENDPFFPGLPGALVRSYTLAISFGTVGDAIYTVAGDQLFYVVAQTVPRDGVPTTRYLLRGQVDLTTGELRKGVEPLTWGDVKAMWW